MEKTTEFLCPMTGRLLDLSAVPDEVFADKVMGDGFAVDLQGKDVVAPVAGVVESVFPGGHAVCMVADNGCQILIHIGLETHHIPGVYRVRVKAGQRVKQGELLVTADYKKVRKHAHSPVSPVVFLNQEKVRILKEDQLVKAGENHIVEITYGGQGECTTA
ncbi:MAG: PTS glucose transporter subunit IIA [Lachnospiraceae bacterium]|nr:PTS glucose transporter subunit IIA [Lachnospiraceae bacterium]